MFVFGLKLKERSHSIEEGKSRAERAAALWLKNAIAALDAKETPRLAG